MDRVKVTDRKWFTKDDKIFILDKSHGKCCHCGKDIKIGDNFTVEHAIPISKGGTNDIWNIIALCEECNKTKSNDIIDPMVYYKFLGKEHLEQLNEKQCEYYKNVNWLDKCNFTKEDKKLLKVPSIVPGAVHRYARSKNFSGSMRDLIFINFIMEKAQYSDLDDVVRVYEKYMRKFNINISKERVHKLISEIFSKGVIYIIRNSSKEVVGALPVALVHQGEVGYIIKVFTPAYSRPKPDYFLALMNALDVIVDNIFELKLVDGYVPLLIDYCAADKAKLKIDNSVNFKVDSMYRIDDDMDTVLSEIAIYMPLNSDMEIDDYNKLFGDFSDNLIKTHHINTSNTIDYRYDYWRN